MRKSQLSTAKMLLDVAPENRQINKMPSPYASGCTPYEIGGFPRQIKELCQNSCTLAALKISKAIVLGNVSVGKSCLVNRFCQNAFDQNYKATIGVDFEVERFDILKVPFNLQIWDTAGQERFKCIASSYYRDAHAVIVVFDMTDLYSLTSCPAWLEDALKVNAVRPIVFLVGTKRDLLSEAASKHVEEQAMRMARALRAEYWTVSSKTGANVDDLFRRVATLSFNEYLLRESRSLNGQHSRIGSKIHVCENPLILAGTSDKKAKTLSKCCNN